MPWLTKRPWYCGGSGSGDLHDLAGQNDGLAGPIGDLAGHKDDLDGQNGDLAGQNDDLMVKMVTLMVQMA